MWREYVDAMSAYYKKCEEIDQAQYFKHPSKEVAKLCVERDEIWRNVLEFEEELPGTISKGEKIYRLYKILHEGEGHRCDANEIADLQRKLDSLIELLLEDVARAAIPI